MTHPFPTLYKKTSTGAIQWWTILVESTSDTPNEGVIVTQYGQTGTDKPQETRDRITKGKNVGKKNETSPYDQAVLEAAAKHEKQRKKGYVDTAEAAEAGEVDAVVQGGILPMLAHKFAEQGHKIVFPALGQPKLDGMRCIAIIEDGKASLWSRERNPIISAPHIVRELEERFSGMGRIVLDGELYNHDMKKDFERFMSLVRQKDRPHPDHELIQYYLYDLPVPDLTFYERSALLSEYFTSTPEPFKYLRYVMTFNVQTDTDAASVLDSMLFAGYEGLMLRNQESRYVNKRSYDLQKIKQFDDGEFPIIDIVEGRGRLMGHVGAFVCQMPDGAKFEAKMEGSTERLRDYWVDHSLWRGKRLTVRYQGLTGKNGVPRFPIGVTFRDYEG